MLYSNYFSPSISCDLVERIKEVHWLDVGDFVVECDVNNNGIIGIVTAEYEFFYQIRTGNGLYATVTKNELYAGIHNFKKCKLFRELIKAYSESDYIVQNTAQVVYNNAFSWYKEDKANQSN